MRISRITTKRLFGIFDHEIPLCSEGPVTIMHGINGVGKTVLLTMLDSLFGRKFSNLKRIPFEEFSLLFDDISTLTISKKSYNGSKRKLGKSDGELNFKYHSKNKDETHTTESLSPHELDFPLNAIDEIIPDLMRVGPNIWFHKLTGETLSVEDILERFGNSFPRHFRVSEKSISKWLSELLEQVNVRFIEVQRLFKLPTLGRKPDYRDFRGQQQVLLTVSHYSSELANTMQNALAGYASLAQNLDRSFPARLIKAKSSQRENKMISQKLQELEDKRAKLKSAGLWEQEGELEFPNVDQLGNFDSNIISVYVEDVEKKLSFFDELTQKLDLLISNINARYSHKQLSINRHSGFVVQDDNGRKLDLTSLSSGEQHELVLMYEFLFKVKPNSLILIDEPELSLHIAWQQDFVPDLIKMAELGKFYVLLATHSPALINDRWDITVELGGRA